MWEDLVLIGILLGVLVGFWLTRNSKMANRLPGMSARDALYDARRDPVEHGEAFEDEPEE